MTYDRFPDWIMPDDVTVDPPMSDYLALAEWYLAHVFDPGSWDEVRAVAAERREMLGDNFDPDAVFRGWHNGIKSMMNFLPNDCPQDFDHILQHVVRGFQYASVVLLLTLEPETPDPFVPS